jgi:cellulose synthase/poly-beta-1,6-N-acetylglucosamine synthase-like glycosyltransferase
MNAARKQRENILSSNIIPLSPSVENRLGDILIKNKMIAAEDLSRALHRQISGKSKLGKILQTSGALTADQLLNAISEQTQLRRVNLEIERPDPRLLAHFPPEICLRYSFIPWRSQRGRWIIAIEDPATLPKIEALAPKGRELGYVLARGNEIRHFVANTARNHLSNRANTACPTIYSSKSWNGRIPQIIGIFLLTAVLTAFFMVPQTSFLILMIWIFAALVLNTCFRLVCLFSYLTLRPPPKDYSFAPQDQRVSVLIPLLREHDIIDRLIQRMSKLSYPKDLLQICLVYEEDDVQTKLHLATRNLPTWFSKIEVPKDSLQTKPRAMNYALDFCTGDIIGVYDAEDAPEPDQIQKVVSHFHRAPKEVAALQCILDFYNSKTNWLSRCFTIEYAILFRVVLKGLDALRLPIPLGGTSVYFRRSILENLGRWDAYNVTEDAELGMRLKRHGYRTEIVHSITYEEANFRLMPWVKQRSRWLKGFLLTWITHMRHPRLLYNDLGLSGFIMFNILFIGTITAFASAPIALPMWLLTLGLQVPLYSTIPSTFLFVIVITFILTEATLFVLGFTAVRNQRLRHLTWVLPSMIAYWPIGALAAYKAIYEVFAKPTYWDKTEHGINDADCENEIDRLTSGKSVIDPWD